MLFNLSALNYIFSNKYYLRFALVDYPYGSCWFLLLVWLVLLLALTPLYTALYTLSNLALVGEPLVAVDVS